MDIRISEISSSNTYSKALTIRLNPSSTQALGCENTTRNQPASSLVLEIIGIKILQKILRHYHYSLHLFIS